MVPGRQWPVHRRPGRDDLGCGEWAAPGAVRTCRGDDPDINCRDRFRWELTQDKITLYANGKKLMEHAEKLAREGGFRVLGLMVSLHNAEAVSLYEKLDFRATNLLMRKKL